MRKENEYTPGNCNIGYKEVTVRKKFLYLFLAISFFLSLSGFLRPWSVLIWSGLVICSFSAIVLWMEIKYHFCIIFGFFSLHNFKELGNLEEVKNTHHQKQDRKRVREIVLVSMMIALLYSTIIHVLATGIN